MGHNDQTDKERSDASDGTIVAAILQLLSRVEAVVNEENSVLSSGNTAEIDAIVSRKSHLAVEAIRLMKRYESIQSSDALSERKGSLSRALDANARLLRRHIEAVREVSGIITDVIAASSDDGTYSDRIAKRAGATW